MDPATLQTRFAAEYDTPIRRWDALDQQISWYLGHLEPSWLSSLARDAALRRLEAVVSAGDSLLSDTPALETRGSPSQLASELAFRRAQLAALQGQPLETESWLEQARAEDWDWVERALELDQNRSIIERILPLDP